MSSADLQASLDCSDDELYQSFQDPSGNVTPASVLANVHASGIVDQDPRLLAVFEALSHYSSDEPLSKAQLLDAGKANLSILHQIACNELVIANFAQFVDNLRIIYDQVKTNTSGANADYIPVLRDADPEKFGVAFCSTDGQFCEIGDSRDFFSIQSTSKALTFALALEKLRNEEDVLQWVGIEPSGRAFNDTTFLPDNRPFNPMVNSGALMTAGVLASANPETLARDTPTGQEGSRGEVLWSEILQPLWTRLSGNGLFGDIGFSDEVFISERRTADNNRGIAYLLKARKGLPPRVSADTMIDFYLRACATTNNAAGMAVMAATLANGGRNPFTGDQVVSVGNVKKTLSVLTLCGFYDAAGEFFFRTGIPSKSGVSGIVFLVLPNVGGFAIFSPRLDSYGNSVRASQFSKKLVELFTFHSFDNLSSGANGCKLDPRFSCDFSSNRRLSRLRWALAAGDERAARFGAFLVDVCVHVAHIDGSVDESEVHELRNVYYSVTQTLLPRESVERVCKKIAADVQGKQEARDCLIRAAQKRRNELDDTQKDLVLEAAFKVSTADGKVTEQEESLLYTLAEALNVPSIVMSVKLDQYRKQKKGGKGENGDASQCGMNGISA